MYADFDVESAPRGTLLLVDSLKGNTVIPGLFAFGNTTSQASPFEPGINLTGAPRWPQRGSNAGYEGMMRSSEETYIIDMPLEDIVESLGPSGAPTASVLSPPTSGATNLVTLDYEARDEDWECFETEDHDVGRLPKDANGNVSGTRIVQHGTSSLCSSPSSAEVLPGVLAVSSLRADASCSMSSGEESAAQSAHRGSQSKRVFERQEIFRLSHRSVSKPEPLQDSRGRNKLRQPIKGPSKRSLPPSSTLRPKTRSSTRFHFTPKAIRGLKTELKDTQPHPVRLKKPTLVTKEGATAWKCIEEGCHYSTSQVTSAILHALGHLRDSNVYFICKGCYRSLGDSAALWKTH